MAERHPDLVRRQPEVLARHLTEAGLTSEAIEHWLKAGQLAAARSATVEAVSHLTNGLGLLARLEGGIERDRMELEFQTVLGSKREASDERFRAAIVVAIDTRPRIPGAPARV